MVTRIVGLFVCSLWNDENNYICIHGELFCCDNVARDPNVGVLLCLDARLILKEDQVVRVRDFYHQN